MSKIISSVLEIISNLKSKEDVKVKFVKKSDGTDRVMFCTLNFDMIPIEKHPKSKKGVVAEFSEVILSKPLRVYDREKEGWRSLIIDKLEWLSVGDKKYEIQLEKE